MTMRRMRWLAALLLAVGLLAAGCRGGGDAGGGDEAADSGTDAGADGGSEAASEEGSEAAGGGEIATDVGVTEEPCPEAVNEDHGCIYLGTLSDLTVGPFAALGTSIVEAQGAFWNRVNEEGGIGDAYDIDVTTYVEDTQYNPELHAQAYGRIEPEVLALAQTLGSPPTAAILPAINEDQMVSAPATWTSLWAFEDLIVESGNNYCIESINSIDWALENYDGIESVLAIHYPGDYGDDGAAGARIGAEANNLTFAEVSTNPGADNQAGAIDALVSQAPDLAILTTNPTDMATIVGQAAAAGFQGRVIGTSPTWNPGVITSPAVDAVEALYVQSGPWATYSSDTPGHQAMREALGTEEGDDGNTSGWVWSYPLLAALEQAAENGDLTRAGLAEAVTQLEEVDYEGMLPEGSGNYAAEPNDQLVRGTVFSEVDRESSTGVSLLTEDFYIGPTAESFDIGEGACYQQ